jgi:molecular chaperone DnaK (HSP70)
LTLNHYAIRLYDVVERAKIALSSALFDVIQLRADDGNCIDLWQPITRAQFEALIAAEIHRIETGLLDTLERSGLASEQIDAVVRTGGSAQIPHFVEMLGRVFGPKKVVLTEVLAA